LPARLSWRVWALATVLFVTSYFVMWSVVHVYIDLRPCEFRPDDPLFRLVPRDGRWRWVTHDLYTWLTVGAVCALVARSIRGDHRPLVLFGTALGFQAILRSSTLLLLPLCRINVAPGSSAITSVPLLDLGWFAIPWRVWATNDLVFSGHVGEFLLLYWTAQHWPPNVRRGLVVFQLVQIYGLLATRGHYTIDILLAVPCALFEFRAALWTLQRVTKALPAIPRRANPSLEPLAVDENTLANLERPAARSPGAPVV
jgi:hypothetical protein